MLKSFWQRRSFRILDKQQKLQQEIDGIYNTFDIMQQEQLHVVVRRS